MASRVAPYLRYYAGRRPLDDHSVVPLVLVVFDDESAAAHFLRVAEAEMRRAGVKLRLWVSHRDVLERIGPLGSAWQTPGSWGRAVPSTDHIPPSSKRGGHREYSQARGWPVHRLPPLQPPQPRRVDLLRRPGLHRRFAPVADYLRRKPRGHSGQRPLLPRVRPTCEVLQ